MDNIIKLYEYIKSHHSTKYISATCEQNEISIVFHRELTIKIVFSNYYYMYVNDIFYYDIDEQDIVSLIDDIFIGSYVFYKIKSISGYKIKLISVARFCGDDNNIISAWTINETIK